MQMITHKPRLNLFATLACNASDNWKIGTKDFTSEELNTYNIKVCNSSLVNIFYRNFTDKNAFIVASRSKPSGRYLKEKAVRNSFDYSKQKI
uniref:Uncharacterized protein n=1 Tax=Romanomermis culicivorax TaxID=13658 RepID=A0A915IVW9_ROMCU